MFAIFFGACCAAATTGAVFQPGDWYERLDKPPWTPPDWVFPVAWTSLYIMISVAGARAAMGPTGEYAVALWALQIALNTLWTPIFFGLRRLKGALVVIAFLWIAVALTMIVNFQNDIWAGLLFVPYLIWVTIASALNFSVMRRNPDVEAIA